MEERLDEGVLEEEVPAGRPTAEDKDLDAVLFDKMHRYETPYQNAHWSRMEQQLQRVFEWPALVLRYKALEMAIMLLLFLGLWQYFPRPHAPADIQAFRIPLLPAQQQADGASDSNNNLGQKSGRSDTGRLAPKKESPTFSSSAGTTEPTASTLSSVSSKGTSSHSNTMALSPLPSRTLRPRADETMLSDLVNRLPATGFPKQDQPQTAVVAPIDTRSITELPYDHGWLNGVQGARAKRGTILRLGMFGNGEYNHILVPASKDQRLSESFERAAWGYGGGLSLSVDFGRIELGTGLVYAARRYPVGILYLEGSVAEGFEGDELRTTELNIINLPIHLRYDVVQRGKWRGYILGGGAVQVAFQTSYFTADAPPQYNFRPPMPIYSDGGSDGAEKAIDRIRQNGVGWFEGGSFEDNAYLTANFGFGLERFISDRWSLFAQPVYQHSFHYFKNIDGLGPNKDRINSLSVLFGTRVRLK